MSKAKLKKIFAVVNLFLLFGTVFELVLTPLPVKAAPPSNTTAVTAIDMGALPYSNTQNVHDAGTTYTVWYKFTATQDGVVGVWGHDSALLFNYDPQISIWLGPDTSPVTYLSINTGSSLGVPVQFPVEDGTTYWIRALPNNGTVSPAEFAIEAEYFVPQATPEGTILVPDDTSGRPLGFISQTTDYTVLDFLNGFPASESGDINSDNIAAQVNGDNVDVWDIDNRSLIATLPYTHDSFPGLRVHRSTGKFYIARDVGSDTDATTILPDGTFGPTTWNVDASAAGFNAIAPSNDESILYYADGGFPDSTIQRWDLNTDSALSDLVGGIANHRIRDMVVLDDDSIVALYESAAGNVQVGHYSAAGASINVYNLGVISDANAPRMAYDLNNNDHVWLMTHPGSGISRFLKINLSTGAADITRDHIEYEGSVYQGINYTDPERFGVSFSCPFYLMFAESSDSDFDLVIEKTASDDTPDESQNLTYTVTVTNNGPDDATDIEITDVLPDEVTFDSYTASQGTYDTDVWTVGDLANGEFATLEINVTVNNGTGGTNFNNTATITTPDDSDGSNNASTSSVTTNNPPPPPPPPPPSSGGRRIFNPDLPPEIPPPIDPPAPPPPPPQTPPASSTSPENPLPPTGLAPYTFTISFLISSFGTWIIMYAWTAVERRRRMVLVVLNKNVISYPYSELS